jgi:L-lactate dehydrogenase complex protein LldF
VTTTPGSSAPTIPTGSGVVWLGSPGFPEAARIALADPRLRANLRHATATIRDKRLRVTGELDDWEQLRDAGAAIKRRVARHLDGYLVELERSVTAAGGVVHWARDADEANTIVGDLVAATGADEVVKVKSMVTQEIDLNAALEARGIRAHETDLAELIVQLAGDRPSHILVPAIHRNRSEIRDIFVTSMRPAPDDLTDDPAALAEAARRHLRAKFLRARVAISGANFAIAATGTVGVVESEGNGRMCLTLPQTLITVMGIEKVLPDFADLEVFLQLLPRSSTGERMNPYTSMWTGVTPGDGPQEFHLVLLDNGRTATLADEIGRQTLACIRCSACLNVCPVYERTGGHAYGSVYPGPIGAVLTPQLLGVEHAATLPFASTLCGACYDACPVKINIPEVLTHLRAAVVARSRPDAESLALAAAAGVFASPRRFGAATRLMAFGGRLLGRHGVIRRLPPPLGAWSRRRDTPVPPAESFRAWWRRTGGDPARDRRS